MEANVGPAGVPPSPSPIGHGPYLRPLNPHPFLMSYDVIVLGSGPGGYVAAIRASQLGLKTAVVEREALGGICLNWGCIPTKALLKNAQMFENITPRRRLGHHRQRRLARHEFERIVKRSRGVAKGMSNGMHFLMKKNKIDPIMGTGKLLKGKKIEVTGADGKKQVLEAKHILIATGARSRVLPNLPQDGKKIIGYREAMVLAEEPKSIIVVGSGAIGIEFAYFYNAIGTKVTVMEFMPNRGAGGGRGGEQGAREELQEAGHRRDDRRRGDQGGHRGQGLQGDREERQG